jgi:glycosyltransferase involved in cell wall biosynthesis
MLLSVVIPVYQADEIISELISRIKASLISVSPDYEIILIDDGSTDNSWMAVEKICDVDNRIKAIKLSRNFGQHSAITSGLDFCIGDWIVVMDCDLQDKPEEIPKLWNKAKEGYDIIFARRLNRADSFGKRFYSKLFYRIYSWLTGIKHDGSIANFGLYSRKVIEAVKKMREPLRAFSPMVRWVGFNKAFVNVEHGARHSGKSTYNFNKVFSLGTNIILSYSDKPLKMIIRLGFIISILSFAIAVYYFIAYFTGRILVSGFTTIVLSIWFLGGLIILILGVIGLYISKIFAGIKNRPLYIIDKSINL